MKIPSQFYPLAAFATVAGVGIAPAPLAAETASPADMVDALHSAFGTHRARAVHAKGVILEGSFTPDPEASTVTKAFHLQKEPSRVIVRFSNFTGIPDIPDNVGLANPRGLAIKFITANGANIDIVGHSFNGFPTPTSDEFRELLLAIGASGPGVPEPTALSRFVGTHAIARKFLTTQNTPASFGTISYFGVNSFQFTNAKNRSRFIRYQFIPTAGEQYLTPEEMTKKDPKYLIDEIEDRVAREPVAFKLYAQIAEEGDAVEDPSVAWPDQRRKIFLGTIKLDHMSAQTPEADKALRFNPGNLPDGILAADPMVKLRAAAYPISVQQRQ